MKKIKKHIGAIILLIIALVFPTSLSNQTKLNMRIIVTGLAIDKVDDEFEVTAQIIKTAPGSKSGGAVAEIDFITDKAKLLSGAVSKLAYKAGKVSAFSHTNFIILGKSMLKEDLTESLDYFIRDKIIKNSALLLFSENSASDEIKKTKNTEFSVGIGLQKTYLFKEYESDGLMTTMIDFLNANRWYSKTAVASEVKLEENKTSSSENSQESSSGGESSSKGASAGGSKTGGNEESGNKGTSEESSGSQFFEAYSPIMCFKSGIFKGKLESEDEVTGFMLANKKTRAIDIDLTSETEGVLFGKNIEINIKNKINNYKLRFEENVPCIDVFVNINNSEINEILSSEVIGTLSEEEYEGLKKDISNNISKRIASSFTKAKSFGADIFNAYELAYKYHYKKLMQNYKSPEEFLEKLKLNVVVSVHKLDY